MQLPASVQYPLRHIRPTLAHHPLLPCQMMPLVSLPVADSILGYVGSTVTNSMRLLAKDTPLSIDRVQAARLYAGMLEVGGRKGHHACAAGDGVAATLMQLRLPDTLVMCETANLTLLNHTNTTRHTLNLQFGYFSRCLERECAARGIPIGSDSDAMIKLADSLGEEELRSMCSVQTADGWYSAVRFGRGCALLSGLLSSLLGS